MGSGQFDSPYTASEAMQIDTSFLDAYRSGGKEALDEHRKKVEEQADREHDGPDEQEPRPEAEPDSGSELEFDGDPGSPEPELDAEGPEREAPERAGQRGGSSGGSAGQQGPQEALPSASPAAVEKVRADSELYLDDRRVPAEPEPLLEPAPAAEDRDLEIPVPLQHTDHQEDVQATAQRGGSSSSSEGDDADLLPLAKLNVVGMQRQPHIKGLPEPLVLALREQLRSAAVRELGVAEASAREFSERVSQATLVIGFLLGRLDLRVETDPATETAARLFRSHDPLLGSAVERLSALESLLGSQAEALSKLRSEVGEVRDTTAVVEQATAYALADREVNFMRGDHDIKSMPLTHKDAVYVRDRARELTKKQMRLEREQEGRPMR